MINRITDLSTNRPRMAFALALSLLLHLLFLLAWHMPQWQEPGSGTYLSATLLPLKQPGGAPVEQVVGAQGNARSLVPAEQSDIAPAVTTTGPTQAVLQPASQAAESNPAGPKRGTYYVDAAIVVGEYGPAIFPDVPAMRDPAYKLMPQPKLPARVAIDYPEGEKRSARKAMVRIAVATDESGRVVEAVGLGESGNNRVFVDAAIQSIRKLRFEPAQAGGVPLAGKFVMVVSFGFE